MHKENKYVLSKRKALGEYGEGLVMQRADVGTGSKIMIFMALEGIK
jgi:hypothetical protein